MLNTQIIQEYDYLLLNDKAYYIKRPDLKFVVLETELGSPFLWVAETRKDFVNFARYYYGMQLESPGHLDPKFDPWFDYVETIGEVMTFNKALSICNDINNDYRDVILNGLLEYGVIGGY